MTSEETDDLIFRYLAGQLDGADHGRLEGMLTSDAIFCRRFAELSLQETLLYGMGEANSALEGNLAGDSNKRWHLIAKTSQPGKTPDTLRRFLFFGGLAAAVAFMAGAVHFYNAAQLGTTTLTATVIEIRGSATLQSGTVSVSVLNGVHLAPGDTLKTAADSEIRLQYPDKTVIELLPGSELTLLDLPENQQKRLRLETGALQATVSKQPANQPLLITTPQAEVKVVGTVFEIRVNQTQTRLEVKEGTVRMTRLADRAEVSVASGQSATATPSTGGPLTSFTISDGTYVIKAVVSGLALADENSHAVQQTYSAATTQQWQVSNLDGAKLKIVCVGTNRALEVPGSNTTAGINLETATYSGGSHQQWKIVSLNDGRYEIINASSNLQANVAYSATEPGRAICQWTIGDYPNGIWTFTPVIGTQTPPTP
jgi:hypothetical protein